MCEFSQELEGKDVIQKKSLTTEIPPLLADSIWRLVHHAVQRTVF